jgi:1,2-diacylglycerol 3-beta-galactosyltransferase
MLAEFWSRSRPDLVVSVVPNFNRALFQGLRQAHPDVPFVTILTDFADYPPHFWIEHQDQHYICGTDKALEQARRISAAPEKAYRVSGMILRPMFYQTFTHDDRIELKLLGLTPDRPTGIVLFGGQGSRKMVRIVEHLQGASRDLQLILICGRNEKLAARLKSMKSRVPLHVVGFTDQVPYYMALSDFFIGKPGPGSISEALAMHLPVVIECNAWTLPQERYNAEWVSEKQVGVVLSDLSHIGRAVDEMLEPSVLTRYRSNAAAIDNRAVFEIPDILEGLMR